VYNDSNDSKILAMTEYVTTRWYRAPEVLVGWHRYTTAVDMWAVGCIVAELIGRMPLFPGANSMKQLELLCRFSGKPHEDFISKSRKSSCRQYMSELPKSMTPTDVRSLYPGANPLALDLIQRLLEFEPENRISAEEALRHPYIDRLWTR
jgi:serine/threonine protein kinase